MNYITLDNIKPDNLEKKTTDTLNFSLTISVSLPKESDLQFFIFYLGNPNNDEFDQLLSEELVGPLKNGTFKFDLEVNQIDIDKIPKEYLFGVTSILILGSFDEKQFVRAGFIVNVSYPGLPNYLLEKEEKVLDGFVTDQNNEEEIQDIDENVESPVYESSSEITDEEHEEVEDGEEDLEEQETDGENEGSEQESSNENDEIDSENEDEFEEIDQKANEGEEQEIAYDHKTKLVKRNEDESEEGSDDGEEISEDKEEDIDSENEETLAEKELFLKNPDFQLHTLPPEHKLKINGFVLDKRLVKFQLCIPPIITQFDCFQEESEITPSELGITADEQ